jgi:chromosome segregation ATPase
MQAQVQALRAENAALTAGPAAEMERLQAELDSSRRSLAESLAHHSASVSALQKRLEETKAAASSLQERLEEVSSERDFFMTQRNESSQQISALSGERDALKQSLQEAVTELDTIKEVQKQLAHACSTLASSLITWVCYCISSELPCCRLMHHSLIMVHSPPAEVPCRGPCLGSQRHGGRP